MASSILEALDIIANNITVIDTEIIPIEMSVGRVVTEDYIAIYDLPRFNNSAMDGYAVKVDDAGKEVTSSQVIYAGDNPTMTLEKKEAIKIMTGAPIPKGCEAIVPIEDMTLKDDLITLPLHIKQNGFIRMAGEDIQKGTIFLKKGETINAYTVASLASQGMTHVSVHRLIKVAIFGTGDELRPHFEKIADHQLYNSNSPMFLTRSKELGCDVRFIRTAADTLEALERSIQSTLDADIIITSGGVSVGDKDFTKVAFTNLGMNVLIDKIDIKPGRPTVIGKIDKTVVVNLPGNPLASMVNYELFVRAIIRKLSGKTDIYHNTLHTVMKNDYVLRGGKNAVVLGTFDGKCFKALSPQMPGMVSPMQKADGLVLVMPNVTKLEKNSTVSMIPIKWELCSNKQEELFTK
ncbi:MAG: Molybdopterin biosynthesis protein MoeA [uncultured Sulfurovum sp.]|uniref:Molybdopterin molybdenumtransferase n=1 Tax=uncultured Sulfurovum sp. TaxID=269237 RepID=A0A6S6T2D1_9BACT|nr:MAG: Molybdopterin biosynthesis protein MoeA [uncultured Sulfurovum sp.]